MQNVYSSLWRVCNVFNDPKAATGLFLNLPKKTQKGFGYGSYREKVAWTGALVRRGSCPSHCSSCPTRVCVAERLAGWRPEVWRVASTAGAVGCAQGATGRDGAKGSRVGRLRAVAALFRQWIAELRKRYAAIDARIDLAPEVSKLRRLQHKPVAVANQRPGVGARVAVGRVVGDQCIRAVAVGEANARGLGVARRATRKSSALARPRVVAQGASGARVDTAALGQTLRNGARIGTRGSPCWTRNDPLCRVDGGGALDHGAAAVKRVLPPGVADAHGAIRG